MIFFSPSWLWEWLWQIDYSIILHMHQRDFWGELVQMHILWDNGSFVPGTLTFGVGAWKVWNTTLSQRSLQLIHLQHTQRHTGRNTTIWNRWSLWIDSFTHWPHAPSIISVGRWVLHVTGMAGRESPPTLPYGSCFQNLVLSTWTLFM